MTSRRPRRVLRRWQGLRRRRRVRRRTGALPAQPLGSNPNFNFYTLKLGDPSNYEDNYNPNAAWHGVAKPYRQLQALMVPTATGTNGAWIPFVWPYSHLNRVQVTATWGLGLRAARGTDREHDDVRSISSSPGEAPPGAWSERQARAWRGSRPTRSSLNF